jgi:hypothetical protein
MAQQMNFLSAQVLRSNLQQFYEKPVTRVSLELFLSLTTVIFFALFALRPTLNTMSRLVREIEEKREVDQELSKKIAALSTAQNEYLTYRSRLSVLDTAVHQDLSIENALIYLEYVSAEAGVALSGLQIREFPLSLPAAEGERPKTAEREIGIHTAQVSFEGNVESIKRLFLGMESIRPLLAVQGFAISVKEERGAEPVVTANATLLFYGYQPKAAAPRAAASRQGAGTGAEE